jgi:hypothetical protein
MVFCNETAIAWCGDKEMDVRFGTFWVPAGEVALKVVDAIAISEDCGAVRIIILSVWSS